MRINTAIILCAGLGKRLNPLTLNTPKPLLKLKNVTMLESCIDTIIKLKIKKIFINTFHLGDKITDFIKNKNFSIDIQIIEDGKEILNTGGGILNMMNSSNDSDFLILNPDTVWNQYYLEKIKGMEDFYFTNQEQKLRQNNSITYTPNLDFSGLDSIVYSVTDKLDITLGYRTSEDTKGIDIRAVYPEGGMNLNPAYHAFGLGLISQFINVIVISQI